GAMTIDFGLGALGLEFIEDPCEFANLPLVESELVDQEAERPPDAESASTTAESFLKAFFTTSFPGSAPRTATRPNTTTTDSFERTAGVPPKGWMHDHSPSRGAIRTRRGICTRGQRASRCLYCNSERDAIKVGTGTPAPRGVPVSRFSWPHLVSSGAIAG